MTSRWMVTTSLLTLGAAATLAAQATPAKHVDNDALVKQALSAAPKEIAMGASVMMPGPDGKMQELKHGGNGWTCLPDNPESPGKDPMCVDAEGMKWAGAWMAHAPKPANTAPGIIYMLQGGSDISATDPWAKADKNTKFVISPPHYMVMWPYDPKATGFSATPKQTGTWIMWAGTPYAHLMVNQVP
jgi:hypothetical protein